MKIIRTNGDLIDIITSLTYVKTDKVFTFDDYHTVLNLFTYPSWWAYEENIKITKAVFIQSLRNNECIMEFSNLISRDCLQDPEVISSTSDPCMISLMILVGSVYSQREMDICKKNGNFTREEYLYKIFNLPEELVRIVVSFSKYYYP